MTFPKWTMLLLPLSSLPSLIIIFFLFYSSANGVSEEPNQPSILSFFLLQILFFFPIFTSSISIYLSAPQWPHPSFSIHFSSFSSLLPLQCWRRLFKTWVFFFSGVKCFLFNRTFWLSMLGLALAAAPCFLWSSCTTVV